MHPPGETMRAARIKSGMWKLVQKPDVCILGPYNWEGDPVPWCCGNVVEAGKADSDPSGLGHHVYFVCTEHHLERVASIQRSIRCVRPK